MKAALGSWLLALGSWLNPKNKTYTPVGQATKNSRFDSIRGQLNVIEPGFEAKSPGLNGVSPLES
jgi:hypothetical protein